MTDTYNTGRADTGTHGQVSNGMGTAALVLGIIAVVMSWYWVAALPLGIVGIVLGVLGRKKAARGEATNRGAATAGMVLGIVGIVLAAVFIAVIAAAA